MSLLSVRNVLGTAGLLGIWSLEVLNYLVHKHLRPTPWNALSQACGYALWALQLLTFYRLQVTDPGMASESWTAAALAGEHHATVCKRSGHLLPERAAYVRRAGGVVLGLDHYCGWLGTPIGLYNRKLFILFVCYSCIFCVMGAAHSGYALLCSLPDSLYPPPVTTTATTATTATTVPGTQQCMHLAVPTALLLAERRVGALVWASFAACHESFAALLHLLATASDRGQLLYGLLLLASVPANVATALFLGHLALHNVVNVLRNRTTLEPGPSKYDMGAARNWQQVFGDAPWTWLLPMTPVLSAADGYYWPVNPAHRVTSSSYAGSGGPPRGVGVGSSSRRRPTSIAAVDAPTRQVPRHPRVTL